jgi:hypothetical protein
MHDTARPPEAKAPEVPEALDTELADKIWAAISLIEREWSRSPETAIVLSSFGKDSMVMLDLFERTGIKPSVLFFEEPHFPRRNAFAHAVITAREYVTYGFLPFAVQPCTLRGEFEIVNYYQFGTTYIAVPLGIVKPNLERPWLCGLKDLLQRPLGGADVPWKILFVGHKASDTDPVHGPVPIMEDVVNAKGMTAVFPLRTFTDADIWAYHRVRKLPYAALRYRAPEAGGGELADQTYNPDKLPACCACFDPAAGSEVFCPKIRGLIPNVSASLEFSDGRLPPYVKQS